MSYGIAPVLQKERKKRNIKTECAANATKNRYKSMSRNIDKTNALIFEQESKTRDRHFSRFVALKGIDVLTITSMTIQLFIFLYICIIKTYQ